MFNTCIALHLLMSLIIRLKKRSLAKVDNDKINSVSKAGTKTSKKSTNLGGLSIGYFCLLPAVSQAYFLTHLENNLSPHLLNQYPYNWYIYIIHFLNPTMIAVSMSAYYYSKSKELRRAVKEIFFH